MYADAYLAQTDGAYSAACGRRVPSRQKPQAPSMTSGLLRRTESRPCSRPAGSLSVLVFWGVRCGGVPEGGGPSALRWMAAGAEFPCGVPGRASALWWMQWNEVLAVFVEGFLLTFDGEVVILKVHIWEHSGPFGYLIPIWLVV